MNKENQLGTRSTRSNKIGDVGYNHISPGKPTNEKKWTLEASKSIADGI